MAMTKFLRVDNAAASIAGGKVLIPIQNIAVIEQASATTCVIKYSNSDSGFDVCTITHTALPSFADASGAENAQTFVGGNVDQCRNMRMLIQDSVADALSTGWTSPLYDVVVPSPRAGFPAATGGTSPVQVTIDTIVFN